MSLPKIFQAAIMSSTTQAFLLMHNPHIWYSAHDLATCLEPLARTSHSDAIPQAYPTTFTRDPTPAELADALAFLHNQTKSYNATKPTDPSLHVAPPNQCHVLFLLNEFVHVVEHGRKSGMLTTGQRREMTRCTPADRFANAASSQTNACSVHF